MSYIPLHVQEGRAEPWRPWFAWYPIRIENRIRWLRWVECRWFWAAPWFVIYGWWEYRLPPTAMMTTLSDP